ncbi:G-type lectin S-receptor-like serine/threonine-protein kinase At1g11410 [Argentina anserina]|uniref:G-type lectin S-receptor-like serine/threonine-protein kinase At1g11410 n=1 Tax=Argentina anserina TaxID=57926 RepID=UPI00217674C9|nr:G-type lectin S-receptor-like serine/threonine-protein kinase At1g11410 [Potentilla anserina]
MLLKSLRLLLLLFQVCTCRDTLRSNQEKLKDEDGGLLVSKESNFELGFFSPGNSSNRYVGIWYSQSRVSEKTVVWIANRDNPINDTSGVFTINRYGELVLYAYNTETSPIWSANVSHPVENSSTLSAYVQLLDTGNLVMFRNDKDVIFVWQSFDYPTDTLVPGMKVGMNWKTGVEWVLTSWKSQDDPGTGDFTFRLHSWNINAISQYFIYKNLSKYWRSDPEPWPNVVRNAEEMSYILGYNTNELTIMKLKFSGLHQHLVWDAGEHQWKELWSSPKYQCDWYGHCGANSKCSTDSGNLFECECLPGYEPKSISGWNRRDGSDGCVSKRMGLSKCGNGEGFVKVAKVKDPDPSKGALLKTSMSTKECEQECLKNCSCRGYLSKKIDGVRDCLTWYDDLMDILVYTEAGRDLYVRVDKIQLAENEQGFFRRGMLVIPVLFSLLALILINALACWLLKRRGKIKDFMEVDELEESKRHPELQFFDLNTLIAATDNFSYVNKLGEGGFGCVYKAELPNEQKVAVKRLSSSSGQGVDEFKNEVELIAGLQHRNLVKLLGCCIKGGERILVLEYMPNKSLDSFLFDKTRSFLNWEQRFDIINGVARGLLYLHQDSRLRIIHRDLKTSNILLDAEMTPKISDFGMARIFDGDKLQDKTKKVVGTYGYMSPEYAVYGRFSTKSDVFGFGIILLEIVSGKRNNGSYEDDYSMNLIGHVWHLWKEGAALEIVDSSLQSYQPDEVLICIQVALLCVQENPKDRPAMSSVVFMLTGETSLPSPDQPAFVFAKNSSILADPKELYSINDLTITIMEARG